MSYTVLSYFSIFCLLWEKKDLQHNPRVWVFPPWSLILVLKHLTVLRNKRPTPVSPYYYYFFSSPLQTLSFSVCGVWSHAILHLKAANSNIFGQRDTSTSFNSETQHSRKSDIKSIHKNNSARKIVIWPHLWTELSLQPMWSAFLFFFFFFYKTNGIIAKPATILISNFAKLSFSIKGRS